MKTKSLDIAECQNEHFLDKVRKIRDNLPQSDLDPHQHLKDFMKNKKCKFDLSYVHPQQVHDIISSMSNSGAFGLDDIDSYIIKLVKDEVTPALTHIINLSIKQKKYPDIWKDSKVVPLYKKNDILNPENYRPISLIPVVSKILERAICDQMMKYLTENNLLHPNQHAYKTKHNTTTAMLQMTDKWTQAIDSGQMAGVCLIDMSAAFDLVDHNLMIEKMSIYGFSESTCLWFLNYLSNRRQCVSINGGSIQIVTCSPGSTPGFSAGAIAVYFIHK